MIMITYHRKLIPIPVRMNLFDFRLMLLLVLCTHGNNLSAHVKLDRQPRFHFLNNATTLTPPQERKSKRFHFLNNSTTLTSEQQRRSKQLEGKWVF